MNRKGGARPLNIGRSAIPPDVIALGPKQKSNEAVRSLGELRAKKSKPNQPSSSSPSSHYQQISPIFPEPNVLLIDVPFQDLVGRVIDENDFDTINGILCSAIKHLRKDRSKPDQILYCSLFTLAKERPTVFISTSVVDSLVNVLKKDVGLEYMKSKTNSQSSIIACSLLMHAFELSYTWPPIFIKVFLDDSLGDRVWVDHPSCREFVRNICTVFGTKFPKVLVHDEKSGSEDQDVSMAQDKKYPLRFAADADMTISYALDKVKEKMIRRQGNIPTQDVMGAQSRNLLRTLAAMCGISEIRLLASQKLEMWLQNPKLVRSTQNLIMSICVNCGSQSQDDVDVIAQLTRMKVKNKANLTSYLQCLKELVQANAENLSTLFHFLVYNELSSARNPINMNVISSMLYFKPVESAKMLALVWQDLLLQNEDYLRASRGLIREILRSSKYSVHFPSLVVGVLQEPNSDKFSKLDQAHKERFVASTIDITCLLMLLSVTPAVKEVLVLLKSKAIPLTEEHEALNMKHKMELAEMQCAAIWWLHSVTVPKLLPRMSQNEFISHTQKFLFLKSNDVSYHTKDNWPPESDRSFLIKSCGDVPVLEDTIVRLVMIGLSNEHPIPPAEIVDIISAIVKRAALLAKPGFNPLPIETINICEMLISLSQYHHPENIKLPSEYVPPSLAILVLYWTVWRILLVISAYNPTTIGYHGWTNYPILKNFMEMAIINNFNFPPATIVDEQERSVLISKEQQMVQVEKNEILEFESYLAAATTHLAVTEESSLLLTQLIAMDAGGNARRPPEAISNITRNLCKDLQLGPWLCRSRNPDFLLDIINRYGENQQMPWLAGVVGSASGDMGMLPVQCLCEFLLAKNGEQDNQHKQELAERLYNILTSNKIEEASQVLRYFIHRLHLPQLEQRKSACQALASICELFPAVTSNLNICVIPEFDWLLNKIECIPIYQLIRKDISQDIQIAIKCETDPIALVAYISFLAKDVMAITQETYPEFSEMLQNIALTISQTLIERSFLIDKILNHKFDNVALIFLNSLLIIFESLLGFTRKLPISEEQNEDIPWCDTQDEIFVKWPGMGGTAQLHVYVSQAIVLVLTFGCPSNYKNSSAAVDYDHLYVNLMNDWFSADGFLIPKAYLMDTQEEAVLLPDWLRIKMMHCNTRSETLRLSIAAAQDLDSRQLLLCFQSFGIPVLTMERLLAAIDHYSIQTPGQVNGMTCKNATYLLTLVQAQWKRGCQSGHAFAQLLSANTVKRRSVIQLTPNNAINEVVDLTGDKPVVPKMEIDSKPSLFVLKNSAVKSEIKSENFSELIISCFSLDPGNRWTFKQILKLVQKPTQGFSILKIVREFWTLLKNDDTEIFRKTLCEADSKCGCLLRIIHKQVFKSEKNLPADAMKVESNEITKAKDLFNEIVSLLLSSARKYCDQNCSLLSLLNSLTGADLTSDKSSSNTSELHQSHWSRLEEFLKQQLASLKKNEEIKEKVDLVAQILLEEISSRKTKVGRGKGDVNDDKFYTSVGTTGLLIDWLQLLDPELLAHHPILQRKLVFELQKVSVPSMPIKMTAKMSASNKMPCSLSAHQTYLLSLLSDHCNWKTVHQCLKWILSDAVLDGNEKGKAGGLVVDPNTAMDFLWVCIHMSNIWKGRENKSSCLKEPVLYLDTNQFCKVLEFLVASASKRPNHAKTMRNENLHLDLFLLYFNKFGQANASASQSEEVVTFIYQKSMQLQNSEIWRNLLAQLFLLQPHYTIWDKKLEATNDQLTLATNNTVFQSVVNCEISALCQTDLLLEKLLDKLGYVRENEKSSTDTSNVIQSSRDEAYDSSLILRKIASFRPAILLRQLPLIISMLNGRTRYEFQEFKHKNHLLFISQLGDILEIIGSRLFLPEYTDYVVTIMENYLQIIKNYCHRARKQTKDIMYCFLCLIVNFQATSPIKAASVLNRYLDTLHNLKNNVYKDHEDVVTIISNTLANLASAAMMTHQNESTRHHDIENIEQLSREPSKEYLMPYLQMISKGQDLENIAQVLNEIHEPNTRKVRDLSVFLPDLVRLFSTCSDSSIRHAAFSLSMQVLKYQPSYSMKIILPAYINCLKCYGSDTVLSSDSSEQLLIPNSIDTDLIARDALTYLPDIVVLCREKALHILELAFKAGSKQAVGIQPLGSMGNIGTPLIQGAQSSWTDMEELISKSLGLLSGNITA